ncbi:MAG: four helix bundle protein [Planctomycetes bacterium]|nr:four helix bundle protein [Planctomycetota bacterium]
MAETRHRQFDLEDRMLEFASRVMDVVDALPRRTAGRHIGAQLMRSGTAPAALYAEAQGAESRQDFVHKMRLALKELRETKVWLKLLQRRSLVGSPERLAPLAAEADELVAIFVTSIATAAQNMKRRMKRNTGSETVPSGRRLDEAPAPLDVGCSLLDVGCSPSTPAGRTLEAQNSTVGAASR